MLLWSVFATALIFVFAAGFRLAHSYRVTVSVDAVPPLAPSENQYRPNYRQEAGPELVFVFVGSSSCRWSTDPTLPAVVESLKLRLRDHAADHGRRFRAIGVSADWVLDRGLAHLAEFGAFDEVSVGGNWTNAVLVDHLWERGLIVSTPSVFIFHRIVRLEAEDGALTGIVREAQELLLSRGGLKEIERLAELDPRSYLPELEPDYGSEVGVAEMLGEGRL